MRTLLLALAVLAAPAAAQTPKILLPRPATKLNLSTLLDRSAVGLLSQGNARVAAPKEKAAPAAPGLHPTALLAYMAWVEKYGGSWYVMLSRSTDGGLAWSKAVQLFSVQGTGTYDFEQLVVGATFHQVYIAMSTGIYNPATQSTWPNDIWVLASEDEGLTWTPPTLVNTATTTKGDADTIRIACANGKAHIAHRFAHFTTGTTQGLNDVFYIGVEIQNKAINIFQPEVRLNNPAAPNGQFEANYLALDADGPVVACSWADSRVTGSPNGNLYAAVSGDSGKTFVEHQLTGFDAVNPRSDQYWEPSVAVTKNNVYIAYGGVDGAGGTWPNNVSLVFSNDLGKNFSKPVVLSVGKATNYDADNPILAADGNVVAVTWIDDRDGKGNNANMVFAACDDQGGQGFLTKVNEIRLDDPTPAKINCQTQSVAVNGNHVVVVYEVADAAAGGGEDLNFAVSHDRGLTFAPFRQGTKMGGLYLGTLDVDDPRVAMTTNGDAIIWWADDRLSANDLYVSGLRLPELNYLGGGQGFQVSHLLPGNLNDLAIVLVTERGTTPPLPLDNLGFSLNFAIGFYTPIFLGSTAYAAVVTGSTVSFPSTPNGLGIFHACAIGISPSSLWFSWFTDPVVY